MDLIILVNAFSLLGLFFQFINLKKEWQKIFVCIFSAVVFVLFWLIHPSRVPLVFRYFLILNFLCVLLLTYLIGIYLWKGNGLIKVVFKYKYRAVIIFLVLIGLFINLARDGYRIWEMETKLKETEITKILPEIVSTTYPVLGNWGSNGRCRYEVKHEKKEQIPDFVEIELQIWGEKVRDGAGWLVMLQPFYDAGNAHYLDFSIKGKNGDEKVGLSVKDIRGNEVPLDQHIGFYCKSGIINTKWQRCQIPLAKFLHVDMEGIESISFFTDRSVLPKSIDPQCFYITDLSFR